MDKDTVSTPVETEKVENTEPQNTEVQTENQNSNNETASIEKNAEESTENPVDWENRAKTLEKEKRDIMELLDILTGADDVPEETAEEKGSKQDEPAKPEDGPVIDKDKTEKGIEKLEARYQQIEFEEAKIFINNNLMQIQQDNQFSKGELGKVVQIMTEFPVKDEATALKAIQTAAKIVKADRIEQNNAKKLLEEKDKTGAKPSGKKMSWNDRWANLQNEA